MSTLPDLLLADENINGGVVKALLARGQKIHRVQDVGLGGAADSDILEYAFSNQATILTHDSDFGHLAVVQKKLSCGIIYLRPGHFLVDHVIEMIDSITKTNFELKGAFVLVAQRRQDRIRIRFRKL